MELKSLLLGLFFSVGIFAVKSGIGLYYFWGWKKGLKSKLGLLCLFGVIYYFIFMVSSHILEKIDFLKYFETVQNFLKTGMLIHILMAGLLLIWGVALLKRQRGDRKKTYGWALLAVPCPVCVTVIFFTVAFLLSYFPDSGDAAVLSAYAGFVGINLLTMILLGFWQTRSNSTPESLLGTAMLIIAAYFFLSVIIMPQFGDLDKIYRLAQYKGENQMMNIKHTVFLYVLIAASFTVGFLSMRRKTAQSSIRPL